MKKLLPLIILAFGFVGFFSHVVPVFAAGDEAPAADAKKDDAKDDGGEEGKDAAKPEEGKGDKKNKDVSGGRFAGDPIYVRMQPFVLPIILPNGIEQLVTVQLTVEVKDIDASDNLHSHMPKVLDALNQALYGSLGDGTLQTGKMVDVDKLKARATKALQKVMGPENVKEVLVINLSQRMLK